MQGVADLNLDELISDNRSKYYHISEFNDVPFDDDLMILHQNIRSFDRNYDAFSVFIQNIRRKVDIIVLGDTETLHKRQK